LAGVTPRAVRYVVSYGGLRDPMAEVEPGVELKLDVDPAWDSGTFAALRRVAVLDFKGTGNPADHERAHRAVPEALIEDALAGPAAAAGGRRLGPGVRLSAVTAGTGRRGCGGAAAGLDGHRSPR